VKVLVACEFSGIVRDAFIKQGHDAISCDLIPTEQEGPHIIGDALQVAYSNKWDLAIFHPPCTYLANSGVRWLYGGKGTVKDYTRWGHMEKAADFFAMCLLAPIPLIAVENPVMHRYGKEIINKNIEGIVNPTIQTVQPWQFGTPEIKATQFWLLNLPPLLPTNIVDGRKPRVHWASPSPDRWKERSRTDKNIAEAMAIQWGDLNR